MKLTGRTGTVQSSPPHHTVYDSSDSGDDGRKILPTAPGRISMWGLGQSSDAERNGLMDWKKHKKNTYIEIYLLTFIFFFYLNFLYFIPI